MERTLGNLLTSACHFERSGSPAQGRSRGVEKPAVVSLSNVIGVSLGFQLLFVAGSGNPQEDEHCTIQPYHVLVGQTPDTRADLRS